MQHSVKIISFHHWKAYDRSTYHSLLEENHLFTDRWVESQTPNSKHHDKHDKCPTAEELNI